MASRPITRLRRAVRTTIRHNAAVYGYSVMITSSLGVLQTLSGDPSLPRIFLFLAGASLAFTAIEAVTSNLFRRRIREERPDVVIFGSAMSLLSVAIGVATATLVGTFARSWIGWLTAPFAATAMYLASVSVELILAEIAMERAEAQR